MSDEMNNDGMKNDSGITDDDKLWAGLSLAIPIFGLIALLMEDKKARPFVKHAAVNGLALGAALMVVSLVLGFIPLVGCFTLIVDLPLILGYQAYSTAAWANIPVVSDFVKGQGWV
ncbi:MAG: hypothetical protein IPL28_14320 [Chloroflexi bacterium]|nr:hypothetical protein [Chloroflexota bacterium]